METSPSSPSRVPPAQADDGRGVIIACVLPFALGAVFYALVALGWLYDGLVPADLAIVIAMGAGVVAVISMLIGIAGSLGLAFSRKKPRWLLATLAALLGGVFCGFVGLVVTLGGMTC